MVVVLVLVGVVALAAVVVLVAQVRRARAEAARQSARADDAEQGAASLDDELSVARAALAHDDARTKALWSLELLRVGREWAASGGADDGSVAADTGAELAMALRMTLDRQREETGVPGEFAGPTPVELPVVTALVALRVVEEVLAIVSRPSEGVTVSLARDGDDALTAVVTLDAVQPDIPLVLRELAAGVGGSITVDGASVVVRVPTAT